MKLKDLVTDFEISKKLKENGIKQDALYAWYLINGKPEIKQNHPLSEISFGLENPKPKIEKICCAFLSGELGEIMPPMIFTYKRNIDKLWVCDDYADEEGERQTDIKEINVRAKMWLYLKKENLLPTQSERK